MINNHRNRMKCKLMIVFALFILSSDLMLSLTDEEIVCNRNKPIKCPVTNRCCADDQFCHTGLCHNCLPDGMSKEKLLVKCRTMNITQIIEDFNLPCKDICQRMFTFDDLNKKLHDDLAFHIQNSYINITTLRQAIEDVRRENVNMSSSHNEKITVINTEIADLKTQTRTLKTELDTQATRLNLSLKEIAEVKKENRELNSSLDAQDEKLRIQENALKAEVKQENSELKSSLDKIDEKLRIQENVATAAIWISACALFLFLMMIIIMIVMWKKIKMLEKHKKGVENQGQHKKLITESLNNEINDAVKKQITFALNPVKLTIQKQETRIKNVDFEALRQEIEGVQRENVNLSSSYNEKITVINTDVADLKTQTRTLKTELDGQATRLNLSLKEIAEVKKENRELKSSLDAQDEKLKIQENELKKLNGKVQTLSHNVKKAETPIEVIECNAQGGSEESGPMRQTTHDQGIDSFATSINTPKDFGLDPRNGFSVTENYEYFESTAGSNT